MRRKVFICVYRHIDPSKKRKDGVIAAISKTPLLKTFLDTYFDDNNFYDWGDDPSFFAAKNYLGDERYATWGVCRPNVRTQLESGDVVIFICVRQNKRLWNYYYIGYGTVSLNLRDRLEVWTNESYKVHRNFYNLLIDKNDDPYEPFSGEHDNINNRKKAGYIFFEHAKNLTNFNFINPLEIAFCDQDSNPIEQWIIGKKFVAELECLLLKKYNSKDRRLRSTNIYRSHPHIKLSDLTEEQLISFRNELYQISEKIKRVSKIVNK